LRYPNNLVAIVHDQAAANPARQSRRSMPLASPHLAFAIVRLCFAQFYFENRQSVLGSRGKQLMRNLVAARAINWAHDPLAGGAYSYATPPTRAAQAVLSRIDGGAVFFSGEALYRGRDMGTVEAALASGLETARTLLG
jgi:hypothetical protein